MIYGVFIWRVLFFLPPFFFSIPFFGLIFLCLFFGVWLGTVYPGFLLFLFVVMDL